MPRFYRNRRRGQENLPDTFSASIRLPDDLLRQVLIDLAKDETFPQVAAITNRLLLHCSILLEAFAVSKQALGGDMGAE